MGHYIMKADRDRDLYVYWSTGVDAPFMWGTREEVAQYAYERVCTLYDDKVTELALRHRQSVEDRLQVADDEGSDSLMDSGKWGEPVRYLANGLIPRDKVAAFLDSFPSDEDGNADGDPDLAMLLPFDWEDMDAG